jgi:hypothetical protein
MRPDRGRSSSTLAGGPPSCRAIKRGGGQRLETRGLPAAATPPIVKPYPIYFVRGQRREVHSGHPRRPLPRPRAGGRDCTFGHRERERLRPDCLELPHCTTNGGHICFIRSPRARRYNCAPLSLSNPLCYPIKPIQIEPFLI